MGLADDFVLVSKSDLKALYDIAKELHCKYECGLSDKEDTEYKSCGDCCMVRIYKNIERNL